MNRLRAPIVTIGLRQLWTDRTRIAAMAVAVVIGAAFVSATFIYTESVRASIARSMTGGLVDVAVVVALPGPIPIASALAKTRAVDGVDAAYTRDAAFGMTKVAGGPVPVGVSPLLAKDSVEVVEGRLPHGLHEVVITQQSAARAGLTVGSSIDFSPSNDGPSTVLGVVGVVSPRSDDEGVLALLAVPQLVNTLSVDASTLLVRLAPDADPARAIADLEDQFSGATVQTGAAYADSLVRGSSESLDTLLGLLLLFAAIAIFTLVLVVRNAFGVLVAQRARQLALMRCIGASRRQLRLLTLIEASLIGLVASVVGVGVGIGVMTVAIQLAGSAQSELRPDTLAVSWTAIVVPLLVGVLATVAAALGPARKASRLHPMLALDPVGSGVTPAKVRRGPLVASMVAFALGTATMILGIVVNPLVAVAGGMISALGVLGLSSAIVPVLARLLGRIVGRRRVVANLAAANVNRNPGRTAAASSALIVGVGLITMMSVGATTMQASSQSALRNGSPIDVIVSSQTRELDPALSDRLSKGEYVGAAAGVPVLPASTRLGGASRPVAVLAISARAASLLPSGQRPEAGTAAIGQAAAELLQVGAGDTISVRIGAQTVSARVRLVSFDYEGTADPPIMFSSADLGAAASAPASLLWLDATSERTGEDLAVAVNKEVGMRSDVVVSSYAAGSGSFQDAISAVLLISTALIAIALLIAVIGVGNTLALSVLERRREIGLLRAVGMSRPAVRRMVGIESLLIVAVGLIIGLVIGVGYGWAGAHALLSQTTWPVVFDVPWARVGLLVLGAFVSALLAAAMPARSAALVSPVRALAAT